LVIADPPRTGLGKGVAHRIAALGVARIAMVSCDPATLSRDLAALVARGYAVETITPFDLFPQTAHVESVAWLRRATASGS
jgi:tRNA/tmRNA/rRNA uracil-C5-methylase (TrmA/RlmC/RlmD family)